MSRYFAVCDSFKDKGIMMPKRSTAGSAGYDFYSAEEIVLPSVWNTIWKWVQKKPVNPVSVPTHIKAKMRGNEVLFLYNRSSNPRKGLILANSVGVVDSDYFGNKNNDGDISFPFYNIMPWPVTIKKGQKIGQGVFSTYLKTNDDIASGKREGGFGSTGE